MRDTAASKVVPDLCEVKLWFLTRPSLALGQQFPKWGEYFYSPVGLASCQGRIGGGYIYIKAEVREISNTYLCPGKLEVNGTYISVPLLIMTAVFSGTPKEYLYALL